MQYFWTGSCFLLSHFFSYYFSFSLNVSLPRITCLQKRGKWMKWSRKLKTKKKTEWTRTTKHQNLLRQRNEGKCLPRCCLEEQKKTHRCSLENVAEPNLWNIAQTFASIFHKGSHRCYLSLRPHTFIEFSLQLEAITGRAGEEGGMGSGEDGGDGAMDRSSPLVSGVPGRSSAVA